MNRESERPEKPGYHNENALFREMASGKRGRLDSIMTKRYAMRVPICYACFCQVIYIREVHNF